MLEASSQTSPRRRESSFFLHRRAYVADETVRQLVGNVQPPAGSAAPQPAAHHAVLAAEEFPERGIVFLHVREIGHVPPAFVAVAVLIAEAEPGAVFFRRAVVAELVKVHAVRAGVVEYAVEHDADAALLCGFAERFKILFPAEQRIDAGVVRRVVSVVACRLKDRVQVQDRDAERGEIRQLFPQCPGAFRPRTATRIRPRFPRGDRTPAYPSRARESGCVPRRASGSRGVQPRSRAKYPERSDRRRRPSTSRGRRLFVYGDLPGARLVVSGTERVPEHARRFGQRHRDGKPPAAFGCHGEKRILAREGCSRSVMSAAPAFFRGEIYSVPVSAALNGRRKALFLDSCTIM